MSEIETCDKFHGKVRSGIDSTKETQCYAEKIVALQDKHISILMQQQTPSRVCSMSLYNCVGGLVK